MYTALQSLIDDNIENSGKHMERAVYYHDNDNSKQALQDLSVAFGNFVYAMELIERIKKKSSNTGYTNDEKMSFLSSLSPFLMLAIKCYINLGSVDEIKYFFAEIKAIVGELSRNEGTLQLEIVKNLNNLRENLAFFERTTSGSLEISRDYISDDPSFSKLKNSV
jgi:hypothetical protein